MNVKIRPLIQPWTYAVALAAAIVLASGRSSVNSTRHRQH